MPKNNIKIYCLISALLLSGCFENKSSSPECFKMAPHRDFYNPIMIDECTGKSWVLVQTIVQDREGSNPALFAYRWHPITAQADEAIMSRPF